MTTDIAARVPFTAAKNNFARTMLRATKGERVILTHHGEPRVAIISAEDLELLEYLEDLLDADEALKTLARNNPSRPARDFFAERGL